MMSKVYTKEEVEKLIEDFNLYLDSLLVMAELESNVPMRMALSMLTESQQVGGIRRLLRLETEQATIELVRSIVSRYNVVRRATGQQPIFVLEDLFSKETVAGLFKVMNDTWVNNDRIKADMFVAAVEPLVRAEWDDVVRRAAEISMDVDIDPLVSVIVQLFVSQKTQQSFMVKMVPRDVWTDAIIEVNRAGEHGNPHQAILGLVTKNELAIMDRVQDWGAELDSRYLAYMMEHLIKTKFPEIPRPQLIM